MKPTLSLTALVAILFGAVQAQGQSVNFNFSDGTADGWANSGFGSSPAATVTTIGGANYIAIPIGGFQVANVSAGANGSAFYDAMSAAAADPAGYDISYNWVVNTASLGANSGTYLQIGTFVNSGSGYYAQDFSSPYEVQLSGAQLTSGQTFSGQVTINMAVAGLTPPAADTFFRLGFIENGDGSAPVVDFSNISVSPVPTPEPATLSLLGLAAPALWIIRRRQSAHR